MENIILCLIILFVATLFLVWLIGYWGIASPTIEPKVRQGQIKVACVGDSITYGLFVKNWYRNSYPKVLGRLLGSKYNVRNFGLSARTGMETGENPYISEKRYLESLKFKPDIVLIMFGTNDSKPQNWKGKDEFKRQYKKLLQTYRDLQPSPKIYLMTPVTPYYIKGKTEGNMKYEIRKPEIEEICDAVKEIAKEWNLTVIDIFHVTDNHSEWFPVDGIHTNKDGAAGIAQAVYNQLKKQE